LIRKMEDHNTPGTMLSSELNVNENGDEKAAAADEDIDQPHEDFSRRADLMSTPDNINDSVQATSTGDLLASESAAILNGNDGEDDQINTLQNNVAGGADFDLLGFEAPPTQVDTVDSSLDPFSVPGNEVIATTEDPFAAHNTIVDQISTDAFEDGVTAAENVMSHTIQAEPSLDSNVNIDNEMDSDGEVANVEESANIMTADQHVTTNESHLNSHTDTNENGSNNEEDPPIPIDYHSRTESTNVEEKQTHIISVDKEEDGKNSLTEATAELVPDQHAADEINTDVNDEDLANITSNFNVQSDIIENSATDNNADIIIENMGNSDILPPNGHDHVATENLQNAVEYESMSNANENSNIQMDVSALAAGDTIVDRLPSEMFIPHESTEEEAEWISMGLGLADALKQIVALTEERDAALAMCQENEGESIDNVNAQSEALLVEVQGRLQAEMDRRAESDSEVRKLKEVIQRYEGQLVKYSTLEDDYENIQANLVQVVSEKSKLEAEIIKLREFKDESEQKEVLLSSRLNEAKKKEANKGQFAGRLEAENETLKDELEKTKAELNAMTQAKVKVESNMEKLKAKAVDRVKQAETALAEERELNEERKRKMKAFVESKAEELREAKESASDMQAELHETRTSLRSSRDREESIQQALEASRIKYRELLRDTERLRRNQEEMHKMGSTLEHELEKSASETEEHKKKRMSAKHELMTMVRTLEIEKSVNGKLRESLKFTFTPKAISQQQLLTDCLQDFETELERLAIKLGKTLSPPLSTGDHSSDEASSTVDSQNTSSSKKGKRNARADTDTERLITNLENETQHVSKGIMTLARSIERMKTLMDEDNTLNCMAIFSSIIGAVHHQEARHQRLGSQADTGEETVSITTFDQS